MIFTRDVFQGSPPHAASLVAVDAGRQSILDSNGMMSLYDSTNKNTLYNISMSIQETTAISPITSWSWFYEDPGT